MRISFQSLSSFCAGLFAKIVISISSSTIGIPDLLTSTALPLSSSLVEASSSPPPQAARANSHSRIKNKHTSFLHRTDYTLLLITQNRQTRHPLQYLDLYKPHPPLLAECFEM